MKTNFSSTILMSATPVVLSFLLAFGATAVAQSDRTPAHSSNGQCSNRTLHGAYGCSVQGVLLNIPGLPPEATFVGVLTYTFDGKGNLTGTEHVVVNGSPFNPGFLANSGTYSVNPDCTGTETISFRGHADIHAQFALAQSGNKLHYVNVDPGISLSGEAERFNAPKCEEQH
jgi:hypothetical protein